VPTATSVPEHLAPPGDLGAATVWSSESGRKQTAVPPTLSTSRRRSGRSPLASKAFSREARSQTVSSAVSATTATRTTEPPPPPPLLPPGECARDRARSPPLGAASNLETSDHGEEAEEGDAAAGGAEGEGGGGKKPAGGEKTRTLPDAEATTSRGKRVQPVPAAS